MFLHQQVLHKHALKTDLGRTDLCRTDLGNYLSRGVFSTSTFYFNLPTAISADVRKRPARCWDTNFTKKYLLKTWSQSKPMRLYAVSIVTKLESYHRSSGQCMQTHLCDQIGLFLKYFGWKFKVINSPNFWWLLKLIYLSLFLVFGKCLEKNCATFYCNIWSHFRGTSYLG